MTLPENLPSKMQTARERYGLSGKAMSAVMGFGVNQWRLYESGKAIPNGPNSKLILMALDPYSFVKLLAIVPPRTIGTKYYLSALSNALGVCKEIDDKVNALRIEIIRGVFERKPI